MPLRITRTRSRLAAIGALTLVTVVAGAACGGGDDEAATQTEPATEVATEPVTEVPTQPVKEPAATTEPETEVATEPAATTEPEESAETGGDAANGATVYEEAGCGSCHTLEAAGSSGSVGPNLDEAQPSFDLVVERVTNGAGAMPSFSDSLDEQQIRDVAAYVVESTQS